MRPAGESQRELRIAGVDEAGRGPLAGPVVAAAVILHPQAPIRGLKDSKKLSAAQRETLARAIREQACAWAVGEASVEEIDALNILQASLLAMRRAVLSLQTPPQLVLVDGCHCPKLPWEVQSIVRGDATEPAISAASILAKVVRDSQMRQLDHRYPRYGFGRHKGYPTPEHLANLRRYGPCPAHRQSFAPVRRLLHPQE